MSTTDSVAAPSVRAAPTRQYSATKVLAVWAAAAGPMAALAWIVAPALAGPAATEKRFAVTLIAALTAGLVWQFVLVLGLVYHERRSLRWAVLREALWLTPPRDATGRQGGRVWLWVLPFVVGFAALQLVPFGLSGPPGHDFGAFLDSSAGRDTLRGNWALFALILVMFAFNTILGEELLFRGLLLPRMRRAFGRADWVANAVLMGTYHLHQPWSIPGTVVAGALFAYPTRRFRSAWMGIIVHSAQSVALAAIILAVVIS